MDSTSSTVPIQTPRARKPRAKPARFVRWSVQPVEGEEPGVVLVTVGKDWTAYFVEALPSDFGRAFRLDKVQPVPGEPSTYDVCLDLASGKHSCECKGFLRWGKPCKHISGLLALHQAGQL